MNTWRTYYPGGWTLIVVAALTAVVILCVSCAPQASSTRVDVDLGVIPSSLPHPTARGGCQQQPAIGPARCELVRLHSGAVVVLPANLAAGSTVLWPKP